MGEEPSIPVIVERIKNVQDDVTDIKNNMATKTDQAHIDARIASLTGALEKEAAERKAEVSAERKERKEEVGKVAGRLQTVEDRMEARKYNTGIAIILSVVGVVLGLVRDLIPPLGGG
jgi:chromosome segregation ATPase